MVHALGESWRVLRVGGRLIDLPPLGAGWPLEIVGRGTRILVGHLDDVQGIEDDVASDVAAAEAVRKGWFEKEQETFFQYAYYWESVEGMKAFVDVEWSDLATLPANVQSEAHRLIQLAGEEIQIRVRRTMLLASYRRLARCR